MKNGILKEWFQWRALMLGLNYEMATAPKETSKTIFAIYFHQGKKLKELEEI